MSIIANTFPDPAERARAIGVFGSMSGLSLGLGPILGGALVDGFCWRSIVRGMSALTAGLCLLPVGVLIVVLSPLSAVLAIYLLFGIFQGTINPPITNAAVSGMPRSMAGVAISLASAGRQTGTTLGVAISGTIVGTGLGPRRDGVHQRGARSVVAGALGLGVGILVLGLLSTGRWALDTARRAAALFEGVDRGADFRAAPLGRR